MKKRWATLAKTAPQSSRGSRFIEKESSGRFSQVPAAENIYITLDVDVMDPTLAPGTGTLEPDGLTFAEIDGLLRGVTSKGRLVGMDIVEVNPMRDSSTRTEQTAIRLLIDTLGSAFK
jgi:agmatinase